MPDISKITLPSGNTYDIKDAAAREAIASLSGGSYFLGVTTTVLTDQATTNPITVNGESVTAINGNMAIYGAAEFVWSCTGYTYYSKNAVPVSGDIYKYYYTAIANPTQAQKDSAVFVTETVPTTSSTAVTTPLGNGADVIKHEASGKWVEFGDLSTLGNLAYKDAVNFNKQTTTVPTSYSSSNLETETVSVVGAIDGVTTSKLNTVTSSVVSALSSVSAGTSKLVTTTIPNVTSAGAASTWGFAMGSGANAETLVISGGNGTAPTLGTAITAATGSLSVSGSGSSVVTGVTGAASSTGILAAPSGASVGDTYNFATGTVSANGSGATVATGSTGGGYVLGAPSGAPEGYDYTLVTGLASGGTAVVTGASGSATVLTSSTTVTVS